MFLTQQAMLIHSLQPIPAAKKKFMLYNISCANSRFKILFFVTARMSDMLCVVQVLVDVQEGAKAAAQILD